MRMKRSSLIEERSYGIKRARLRFVNMVEKRVVKLQTSLVPYLPKDLMFKIFLLLPIKSLLRFTCVCKEWYKLIHCAEFVEAYNTKAEVTPILLRELDHEKPNMLHVETLVNQLKAQPTRVVHFLKIGGQKSKITNLNISCSGSLVATYNGLILIRQMSELEWRTSKKRGPPGELIVMNPATRKFIRFPSGTLPCSSRCHYYDPFRESYGLVLAHSESVYKVVHLFKDTSDFIAGEILNLKTRSWKAVDGPPKALLRKLAHRPISAIGALHWLPDSSGADYIVSMGAEDESFSKTMLPQTVDVYDRLLEMGGFLSFLTISYTKKEIKVWILKGLDEEEWVKQHSVCIDAAVMGDRSLKFSIPFLALNTKEVVFRKKKRLFLYDFELGEGREIEFEREDGNLNEYERIMRHSNNLATWESLEPMW